MTSLYSCIAPLLVDSNKILVNYQHLCQYFTTIHIMSYRIIENPSLSRKRTKKL